MTAASPFFASVIKRASAAAIDGCIVLLLIIFGAAIVEYVNGGPATYAFTSALIYVAYHAAFSFTWAGETPGRRELNIRLVTSQGDQLTLSKSILRPIVRVIWVGSFAWVAVSTLAWWLGEVPIVVDLFLVSVLPMRKSTAGIVCGTLVVNSATVQPHRAPAGPLYSATDAEFGFQPRRAKGRRDIEV